MDRSSAAGREDCGEKSCPRLQKQTRGQQPGYGPSGLRDDQHKDGKNVRQIVQWLQEEAHGDRPFFIACGIQKPHVPFLAPDQYFELYPRENLRYTPARPDFWQQAPTIAMVKRYRGFGFELGVENDSLRREYMQAYHACVSFIDAQIGLLLDALQSTNHWNDTIIVLTSDHGYQLGEHFMWGKVTLFEICDRVPLIIRVPKDLPAAPESNGSTNEGLVELVDLFPTLAELCNVPAPDDVQGRSLTPALRDPNAKGKPVAYTVVTRGQQLGRAIRTDRWRYAKWSRGEELYDLNSDPAEENNLANSPQHKSTLESMREQTDAFDAVAASAKR